ncbi:MAG: TonB-dependent receptor [Gemmatimonadales bacterium]
MARLILPAGGHVLTAARIGFRPATVRAEVIAGQEVRVAVTLDPTPYLLDSVTVLSTRTGSHLEDTPLKVEVVAPEDVSEKVQSAPGTIVAVLREASGLRIQTTSPSLGGAAVRIQGLRGRYTQILADGLPLYGTAAGELSLLQIPPLDLGRVEVIRGVASALYGAQALGGVVNLISRDPVRRHEVLVDQASRDASDLVAFAAGPLASTSGWAYSVLGGAHRQHRQDLDHDGWTDLAGYRRVTVRPRLFWSDPGGSSLLLTAGTTLENREGGTVPGGETPAGTQFPEAVDTRHVDLGVNGRRTLAPNWTLSLRGAALHEFQRHVVGGVTERDRVRSGFAEVAIVKTDVTPTWKSKSWVVGAGLNAEGFRAIDVSRFDRATATPGAFVQYDRPLTPWLRTSTSLRVDYSDLVGTILSPRLSALAQVSSNWSARLSGGTGFAAPTPRLEETAVTGLHVVAPLGELVPERARGASLDLTGHLGAFEIDGTLFGSVIDHALQVAPVPPSADPNSPTLRVVNAPMSTRTWGAELLARWRRAPFLVTGTYAYTHATESDPESAPAARRTVPLTPAHTLSFDAIIEEEEEGQIAFEVSYVGRQALEEDPYRSFSRPYVLLGLLAMKRVGPWATLFLNGENLLDIRLSRYEPLVRPQPGLGGRWTVDAWAPLEGRVVNAGVRLTIP